MATNALAAAFAKGGGFGSAGAAAIASNPFADIGTPPPGDPNLWYQTAARALIDALQGASPPTTHSYKVRSQAPKSAWYNGNYTTSQVSTWTDRNRSLLPYVRKSPTTGLWIPDLGRFPSPPADYPFKDDPTIGLDKVLAPLKSKTRYGGLPVNQWNWLSWRKRLLWGDGSDPGSDVVAVAVLTPAEARYFDSDYAHSQAGITALTKYVGIGIMVSVAAIAVVGTVTSLAAPGALGGATPAATATGATGSVGGIGATVAGAGAAVGTGAKLLPTLTGLITPKPTGSSPSVGYPPSVTPPGALPPTGPAPLPIPLLIVGAVLLAVLL